MKTSSSSRTHSTSPSLISPSSNSASSQDRIKKNHEQPTIEGRSMSQRPGKTHTDPVQVHNRCGYLAIFPWMMHIPLWMSHHQKQGDRRADLQREDGTKSPKGSKAFPWSYSNNGSESNEIVDDLKKWFYITVLLQLSSQIASFFKNHIKKVTM